MEAAGSAERLSLDSAPRRRRDVTSIELDGETVVYAGDLGALHKLGPLGAAIWQCLDGTVRLRQVVSDLRDVFEGDGEEIAADALEYVRDLGRAGLLEGIDPADASARQDGVAGGTGRAE